MVGTLFPSRTHVHTLNIIHFKSCRKNQKFIFFVYLSFFTQHVIFSKLIIHEGFSHLIHIRVVYIGQQSLLVNDGTFYTNIQSATDACLPTQAYQLQRPRARPHIRPKAITNLAKFVFLDLCSEACSNKYMRSKIISFAVTVHVLYYTAEGKKHRGNELSLKYTQLQSYPSIFQEPFLPLHCSYDSS